MKLLLALMVLGSAQAMAAGFEKTVLWSGKEAGYAGAGMSRIDSAESLFFNPAGLAAGRSDAVVNVSPTSLKLSGSIASLSKREETDKNLKALGGIFARYKITDRLGVGVGAYVAGGSSARYESVDLTGDSTNVSYTPEIKTELTIMEYSIGAAFEIVEGLRLGAAWRIADIKGGFSTIKKTVGNTAYSYVNISDAKATDWEAFRLGLQYQKDNWGVGVSYRSPLYISAEGDTTGATTIIGSNTTTPSTGGKTKLSTAFPKAVSFGGNYAFDSLRLLGAVDYVNYEKNQQLLVEGNIGTAVIPNVPMNWRNMWNYRLGGEYSLSDSLRLRAGYALTTRVTSKSDTRATFAPPGTGHTFTAGVGKAFLDGNLELNGAFEYAATKGTGQATATPTGSTTKEVLVSQDNTVKARSLGFHTGLAYRF